MNIVNTGANPYMPLWEHVPDAEPRVFEYEGKKRIYVYGSHDTLRKQYCGPDYVVWSAPVENPTEWTCHGVCYLATDGGVLFAPDVVQRGDTFYLYAAEGKGSRIMVASSKNPAGPFTNPVKTELGFDPGILVDDDNRVYAYWGFCKSTCAELNDDMATIKPGTIHENAIGHCRTPWSQNDEFENFDVGFFEASSPRKVNGKYVYIYSKWFNKVTPSLGVYGNCNGFLSYMYSDSPLDGFVQGGNISLNGGELLYNADGSARMTYKWGNNHGSLCEINNKWFIFYHRQTGYDEYSRQGMVEPVEVAFDKDGKLLIGKINYENGVPVSSSPVEHTSQGMFTEGLAATSYISAGYTCHISNPDYDPTGNTDNGKVRTCVAPVYRQTADITAPVINIEANTVVGFKYLDFGRKVGSITVDFAAFNPSSSAVCNCCCAEKKAVAVKVHLDSYNGPIIAELPYPDKNAPTEALRHEPLREEALLDLEYRQSVTASLTERNLSGKHAVYFEFASDSVFYGFNFI